MMSYRTRNTALFRELSGFMRKPRAASVSGYGQVQRPAVSSLKIHALIA